MQMVVPACVSAYHQHTQERLVPAGAPGCHLLMAVADGTGYSLEDG